MITSVASIGDFVSTEHRPCRLNTYDPHWRFACRTWRFGVTRFIGHKSTPRALPASNARQDPSRTTLAALTKIQPAWLMANMRLYCNTAIAVGSVADFGAPIFCRIASTATISEGHARSRSVSWAMQQTFRSRHCFAAWTSASERFVVRRRASFRRLRYCERLDSTELRPKWRASWSCSGSVAFVMRTEAQRRHVEAGHTRDTYRACCS